MAIVSTFIIPGTKTGKLNSESVSFTITYGVITDDVNDSAVDVAANFAFSVGDTYEGYLISDVGINESADDGFQFEVVLTYGGEATDNPLAEPAKYSIQYQQHEIPVEIDINGQAIVNSAGDQFQEILFKDDSRPIIRIQKNLAAFPSGIALQAKDKVNDAAFLGFAAGQVKFMTISGDPQTHQTIGEYYSVSIEFAVAPDWKKHVLDQGFRYINDDEEKTHILVDNKEISQPALLDGNGGVLPNGGNPVELEFTIYEDEDFSTLFGI